MSHSFRDESEAFAILFFISSSLDVLSTYIGLYFFEGVETRVFGLIPYLMFFIYLGVIMVFYRLSLPKGLYFVRSLILSCLLLFSFHPFISNLSGLLRLMV